MSARRDATGSEARRMSLLFLGSLCRAAGYRPTVGERPLPYVRNACSGAPLLGRLQAVAHGRRLWRSARRGDIAPLAIIDPALKAKSGRSALPR